MEYESGSASLERAQDIERDERGVVKRWVLELKLADKREDQWRKKAEKTWDRYRQKNAKKNSFNILWANTETLRPAIYNSLPKPDVRRRYKDEDPVGKAVAEVLCRSLEYGLDAADFDGNIKASVLDMLLPGRGVARVRYVPDIQQVGGAVKHDEAAELHEPGGEALEGDSEELAWEQAPIEHVQWDDFRIGPGKEWAEIPWIAFRHCMTRVELEEKFPDCGSEVPLDDSDDEEIKGADESVQDVFKTAVVWEVWHKLEKRVLFIAPGYKEAPLLTLGDPLQLVDFYPVPCPLYAVEDSAGMVPVPLFELYKEQADELDAVTSRINRLVRGLKLRGIYDSTLSELAELMRGEDNDLIPCSNASAMMERGGLEKAIWFMPIEQAAKVLKELYIQREQIKAVIYEITGISDILRGATNANETATAQEIKSQWGSSRLKRMQSDVARFVRDLMRLQAEIIGAKFQLPTLQTMTGMQLPTMEQKVMLVQQGQQVKAPSWEEVLQVLRDDKQRTFKVDVETDSTVAASLENDMQSIERLLAGLTTFLTGVGPAVQAGAMPIEAVKEIILAVTRRAKMGSAVEDALDKIQQPEPQQTNDPSAQIEAQKMQREQAMHAEKMRMEQTKLSAQQAADQQSSQERIRIEQIKAQSAERIEAQRLVAEQELNEAKMDFERWKAELAADTELEKANISAQSNRETTAMSLSANDEGTEFQADGTTKPKSAILSLVESMTENIERMIQANERSNQQLIAVISKPKTVLRGNDGRVIGVQ